MKFSRESLTVPRTKEYKMYGSAVPTESNPQPQVFVSTVYAFNDILARGMFLGLMHKQHKIKSSNAVILRYEEVREVVSGCVKNYGIKFVYRSKRSLHNSYQEFRAISKCNALDTFFKFMERKHAATPNRICILSIDVLSKDEVRRPATIEFGREDIMFPIFRKRLNCESNYVPVETNLSD